MSLIDDVNDIILANDEVSGNFFRFNKLPENKQHYNKKVLHIFQRIR